MILLDSINGASHQDRGPALQAVFEKRYAWLLRWALHFTENDRAEAEDLVQETFVRLLLTWDSLRDLDDLEPLLYSYLRYEHLSERRRGRGRAFQRLSTADFDTLAISLRSSSTLDQIDVQNEIREILAFLIWRRRTARFASMFLLRFFHGYFPEEIASICISKRVAVDLGLSQARRELKSHLADPRQIHVLGRSPFPEQKPVNTAIPVDDFEQELRRNIFHAHDEPCPSIEELERAYNSLNQRSIESNLLAHIVTCQPCLDRTARHCNLPPPSSRSMNDSFGRSPRGKAKKSGATDKQRLARVFAEGESRMREIYEHYPTGLVIALNAQVVAVRDITVDAARAVLKVETYTAQTLEIIEVFSEQGLLLMAMPVLQHPPKSQPEIRHKITLSGERTLSLLIRFNRDGALIETTYENPHCAPSAADVMAMSDECTADILAPLPAYEPDAHAGVPPARHSPKLLPWRRFIESFKDGVRRMTPLVTASAVVLVAIAWVIWRSENREAQRIEANQMLRAASRAENNLHQSDQQGVIHEVLRISSGGHSFDRNTYRDLQRKRRPKVRPINEDERRLMARLAEARLEWNNPLSAQGYRDWHDQLFREEDRVVETDRKLLTVTTTVPEGSIEQETLTVQVDDFHPVARTVRFRDGETVQITELSYEILPWGQQTEPWFEPVSESDSYPRSPTTNAPTIARAPLSDEQLDVAELSVIIALQSLKADTERLQITRTPSGVVVKGVVERDERKAAILSRLQTLAHVSTSISSYRDLDARANAVTNGSSIQAVSVAAAETPLKMECDHEKIDADQCRQLSFGLLNASSVLVRESQGLKALREEYPAARPLTSVAQHLLVEVVEARLGHMQAALDQQERVLQSLSVERPRRSESSPGDSPFLDDAVQRNLALCKELVYVTDEHSRSASSILQELALIEDKTRIALSRMAADFGANSIPSFPFATPRQ